MSESASSLIKTAPGASLPASELEQFPVSSQKELMIPTRHGEMRVYFYLPVEEKESYPLFINMHGGGFIVGHRDQDIRFSRNICAGSGYAVADFDYHTAPEYKYPYALEECYDAAVYIVRHAEEFRVDPDKLVLAGHSAGANFCCGIQFMAQETGDFKASLMILDYPPLDLNERAKDKRYADSPFIQLKSDKVAAFNDYYIDRKYRTQITASPLYASREDLETFPPVLMILAEDDSLSREGVDFAAKLIDAGVPVRARRVPGSAHGFVIRRAAGYEIAEEMIFDELSRLFRK